MSAVTGIGIDVHRFAAGRRLVLGGVEIPHDRGLAAHSDGDVLLHALMDALLGAAGMGDIGEHFPDDDERFRGADSLALLADVVALLGPREVLHVDAAVLAERPRLAPHKQAMRTTIARTLGVPPERVNVKAGTNEGMGFIGREEGIAAVVTATVTLPTD